MLLLDSVFINNGGGKVLLDLIVTKLSGSREDVIYLFDSRLKNHYKFLKQEFVFYIKPSIINRHIFYLKHRSKFSVVFTFGNVPPSIYLGIPVFTYFHNFSFLDEKKSFLTLLKKNIINLLKKNTDYWIVQTSFVKSSLKKTFNLDNQKILVYPFFNDVVFVPSDLNKNKFNIQINILNFVYISDGHLYKNHFRLIKAFTKFNLIFPDSSLILTVGKNHVKLLELIEFSISNNVNIINLGIISHNEIFHVLEISDIVIFPSLMESFGLGLIEAALLKKPVIASDLSYVYEVIEPNLTFNPLSEKSILTSLLKFEEIINKKSRLNVKNKLFNLLSILKNESNEYY